MNEKALDGRKEYANIETDGMNIRKLEERYEIAQKEQKEFKENIRKKRQDKLIKLYLYSIAHDTEDDIKRRKKALKRRNQSQF